MREPLTSEEFARLARVSVEEIEEYQKAGLLDPDADGRFDDYDVLRLRIILQHRDVGYSVDEVLRHVERGFRGAADLLFIPPERSLTAEQAAEQAGLDAGEVRALRHAIGLPDTRLVPLDVEVLASVKQLMDAGIPFAAMLEVARVYGDTLARLAQAEVRLLRFYVEEPLDEAGISERERSERLQGLQELLEPIIDPLIQYVHRQHLIRASVEDAVARLESAGPTGRRGELEATIVFVDLASFTPLAQIHGDEVAAHVLERFDGLVRGLVGLYGGTVVKQIGDAFMLTFQDAIGAVGFAVALDEAAASEPHFPAVRAGVHAGRVLYRVGDYVGNTVNLASRIAAMAGATEILITQPVATAAERADILIEPAGERRIHGIDEPVELYRVVRTGARAQRRERDPVCGMLLGPDVSARLLHGGFEFAFCSEECLRRFLEHPSRYTEPEAEDKPIL